MLRSRPAWLAAVLVAAVAAACAIIATDRPEPIFRTDRVIDCEPDACGPGYVVTARSSVDDGSVLALNVVVAETTGRVRMEEIAQGFRSRHEGSRVIVNFFSEVAGTERFTFGLVPTGDEPAVVPRLAPSWQATLDFGREAEPVALWWNAAARP